MSFDPTWDPTDVNDTATLFFSLLNENTTVVPYNPNTTGYGLYATFVNYINATTWANLQPQNFKDRADTILQQPDTILRLILCCLALLTNILSIAATANIPKGLTMHSKLIISLAVADIIVPLSIFMYILNKVLNTPKVSMLFTPQERLTSACMFQFVNSVNVTAHLISLLNLFAMALDHYIAIMRPLHYINIMNRFRGNLLIFLLWAAAIIGGFSNFFTGFSNSESTSDIMNFCEKIFSADFQAEYLPVAVTFFVLVMVLYIYIRIYLQVKSMAANVAPFENDNMHNRKALWTTLVIIGTFVICWLPYMIFQIVMVIQIHVDSESVTKLFGIFLKANKYLYALLLVNCIFDPIIYAVRLKDVQKGYIRLLSRCFKVYKRRLLEDELSQSNPGYLMLRKKSTEVSLRSDSHGLYSPDVNELTPMHEEITEISDINPPSVCSIEVGGSNQCNGDIRNHNGDIYNNNIHENDHRSKMFVLWMLHFYTFSLTNEHAINDIKDNF